MERPLGALRDIPDQRDYLVHDILPESAVIPESVDYTSVYGEVRNQLQLGACVGFASAAMKEGQEHIDTGDHLVFSPLYIYWQRMGKQPGMYPREAMDILSSKGICLDKNLEYLRNMTEIGTVPSRLNAEAANYKISGYYRITTVNELRETLANYGPCFVSIGVTDSFNRLGSSGIWEYKEGEVIKGGHAVCCLPGTIITTKDGFIPIEDIEVGDFVLTHTGKFKRVDNIFSRDINEDICVIHNNCGQELRVTKEHPIMTKKYSPKTKLVQTEKTSGFLQNVEWIKAGELINGNLIYSPIYRDDTIDDNIIYEEDFFELLGMYIGDGDIAVRYSNNGNIKSAKLRFSLGKKYPDLIDRCMFLIKKYSQNSIGIDNFANYINLVNYNTVFAKKIGYICGFAKNKNIPFSILTAPIKYQKAFLKGWYETDGCRSTDTCISIFTAEHNLFHQLLFILKRLNFLYSIQFRKPRHGIIRGGKFHSKGGYNIALWNIDEKFNQKRTKHVSIYNNDYLINKIRGIDKQYYQGKVYNIEVDEDNSYVANGIAVHNCAIGYDDKTKLIKFRNSWDSDWGAKGYFYIRYDDLLKRAWDMYKAIDVKSTKYVAPSIFTRLKEVITWIVRKILHI